VTILNDSDTEDSQLNLLNRVKLLVQNPKDAFSLFSFKERRITALFIFFSYFLIKLPIILQRPYLEGKFDKLSGTSTLAYLAGGLIGGVLITLVLFLFTAWVIHLILNQWKHSGLCFEDAFNLLILSLAPQLLLVFELPFLLIDYQNTETLFSAMILRLVVDLLSLRVFYWGLRAFFNVSATKALFVVILPAVILAALLLKLVFI